MVLGPGRAAEADGIDFAGRHLTCRDLSEDMKWQSKCQLFVRNCHKHEESSGFYAEYSPPPGQIMSANN